jgi:5-methylcytosine-specific restriction endonuclease McrA
MLRLRFDEFAGRCVYCMAPATTIDHVQSLARGGKHALDNIVPACKPCNAKKHAASLLAFLMRRHSQKGK